MREFCAAQKRSDQSFMCFVALLAVRQRSVRGNPLAGQHLRFSSEKTIAVRQNGTGIVVSKMRFFLPRDFRRPISKVATRKCYVYPLPPAIYEAWYPSKIPTR